MPAPLAKLGGGGADGWEVAAWADKKRTKDERYCSVALKWQGLEELIQGLQNLYT